MQPHRRPACGVWGALLLAVQQCARAGTVLGKGPARLQVSQSINWSRACLADCSSCTASSDPMKKREGMDTPPARGRRRLVGFEHSIIIETDGSCNNKTLKFYIKSSTTFWPTILILVYTSSAKAQTPIFGLKVATLLCKVVKISANCRCQGDTHRKKQVQHGGTLVVSGALCSAEISGSCNLFQ